MDLSRTKSNKLSVYFYFPFYIQNFENAELCGECMEFLQINYKTRHISLLKRIRLRRRGSEFFCDLFASTKLVRYWQF